MKKIFSLVSLLATLTFLSAQAYEWIWANRVGGIGDDSGRGIVSDSQGSQFVTGLFEGSAVFGSTTLISSGETDIFVAKSDSNGNWLWAVRAGGTGDDYGIGIAMDSAANVYLTGCFGGTASIGSTTLTSSGGRDIFAAKLDSLGNWLWAVRAGGPGDDYGYGIAADANANIYLTGRFEGTADFGSSSLISSGGRDVFAAKLDCSGNWLWAVGAGGSSDDYCQGITLDINSNLYLTGCFEGIGVFGTNTLTSSGGRDIFVTKLDSSGNFLWAVRAGGTGIYDSGTCIAADANANVYLAGYFYDTAAFGSISLTSSGYDDIFSAKLDSNGNWLWAARAGGSGGDDALAITVDVLDNVYLSGFYFSSAGFGSTTITGNGLFDIFAAKLDSNGNWLWAVSAGGTGDQDLGNGIAVDSFSNLYLTGCFKETAVFGTISLTSGGSIDVFAAKLSAQTGIYDDSTPVFSGSSCLLRNCPNPFSSETSVHFNLAKTQDVNISIFNLKGQLIKTLVNGTKSSGAHSTVWKGDDFNGLPVSSGCYLVRMHTGKLTFTGKLLLVK